MKQQLIDFYLDYYNHYLTIDTFSKDNKLPRGVTFAILEIGRELHEQNIELTKTK